MRKPAVFILLASSTFILIVLVAIRSFSSKIRGPDYGESATEVNPAYRRLSDQWMTSSFQDVFSGSIPSLSNHLSQLPVHCSGDPVRLNSLFHALACFLSSQQQSSYSNCLQIMASGGVAGFNDREIQSCRSIAKQLRKLDLATDTDVVEDAWMTRANHRPHWETGFLGLCKTNSRIDVFRCQGAVDSQSLRNMMMATNSHLPNCGLVIYPAYAVFSPSISESRLPDGELLLADASLMVRFRLQCVNNGRKLSREKAYPVLVRFYWSPARDEWIPACLGVAWAGPDRWEPIL
jgi:hypothetical protein